MIRAGCAADMENAISMHKISPNGLAASVTLAGFGTKPICGAICDDAIGRATRFAAHRLQKELDSLFDKNCTNLDYAKSILANQMDEINSEICNFGQQIGQGLYLAGVLCYIAEYRYICLSFGGGYACIWERGTAKPIQWNTLPDTDDGYIRDALGGSIAFSTPFEEGELHIGSHLMGMTQRPEHTMLPSIMASMTQADPLRIAKSICRQMDRHDMPLAAFAVSHLLSAATGGDSA